MKINKFPNLLFVGHGRHGKDSMAEIMQEYFGLKFKSSSQAAAEIFIYDELKGKYGYKTPEECFEDRVNRRAEWHDLICEYNKEDKAKLAKGILEHADCYVGMRDSREINASKRLPLESKDSFNIDINDADIIIDNNGTFEEFKEKVIRLGKVLFK